MPTLGDWLILALMLALFIRLEVVRRWVIATEAKLRKAVMDENVTTNHLLQQILVQMAQGFRPAIEASRHQRIVQALEDSGAYGTLSERDNLVLALPDKLQGLIQRQPATRGDLTQIVTRAARWDPTGHTAVLMLVEEAIFNLDNSQAARELARIRAEIQATLLPAEDAPPEIH